MQTLECLAGLGTLVARDNLPAAWKAVCAALQGRAFFRVVIDRKAIGIDVGKVAEIVAERSDARIRCQRPMRTLGEVQGTLPRCSM